MSQAYKAWGVPAAIPGEGCQWSPGGAMEFRAARGRRSPAPEKRFWSPLIRPSGVQPVRRLVFVGVLGADVRSIAEGSRDWAIRQ